MPEAVNPLHDPLAMRHAGRELLSLALLDARNHLLARLANVHTLGPEPPAALLRWGLLAGWYQEHWIACHVQRGRGEACDPGGVRLAGLAPALTQWQQSPRELASTAPTLDELRSYLAQTLEVTLELLAGSADEDAALYFYRQSLLHEDRLCETMDEWWCQGSPPARVVREPLWLPAQRWQLGWQVGRSDPAHQGCLPFAQRGTLELALPEFEIDAQPVNWAQFVEFAQDDGYDRRELWSDSGWAWLQANARRSPALVVQLRGAVVVQRGPEGHSSLQRAAPGQPVMHLSHHEAQAWCQWAGRRLPSEAEWELAASSAASRGFVWGDVWEWTAGSARAWPGAGSLPPGSVDGAPLAGQAVLRGGSWATRTRWRHPKARRFAAADGATMFCGFRSCAF